jgi:release factor glutamine methyltransferase
MWLLRPPGVYAPGHDTWLLAESLRRAAMPAGARVLDLGTGTGALAIAAARAGAGAVTAVDVSRRAMLAAWCNARVYRARIRVRRGDLRRPTTDHPFDVVLANPPYVPTPPEHATAAGPARAWNAGPDGRRFLDLLCATASDLLAPGGFVLLVQSAVAGVEPTLRALRRSRLKASVVDRRFAPFGPVLRDRADYLLARGLIEPGQRDEELVVIRGDRTDRDG